jgi:hypothetical protein
VTDLRGACAPLKKIFWPPLVQTGSSGLETEKQTWKIACALSVLPIVATLHHTLFYPHTCILDPFGPDYIPSVIYDWLSRDPSLPWSICIMALAYGIGNRYLGFRILIYPVFVSFLPLSLWVWDIPFTNRTICRHFHGGKLIFNGISITRRYFYLFGFLMWLSFILYLFKRYQSTREPNSKPFSK